MVLFVFGLAFNVVFLVADVLAIDRDEVDTVLNLHFHVKDLVLYHLFVVISVFVAYEQGK